MVQETVKIPESMNSIIELSLEFLLFPIPYGLPLKTIYFLYSSLIKLFIKIPETSQFQKMYNIADKSNLDCTCGGKYNLT